MKLGIYGPTSPDECAKTPCDKCVHRKEYDKSGVVKSWKGQGKLITRPCSRPELQPEHLQSLQFPIAFHVEEWIKGGL